MGESKRKPPGVIDPPKTSTMVKIGPFGRNSGFSSLRLLYTIRVLANSPEGETK